MIRHLKNKNNEEKDIINECLLKCLVEHGTKSLLLCESENESIIKYIIEHRDDINKGNNNNIGHMESIPGASTLKIQLRQANRANASKGEDH
ncbi:hypothetical protein H8356DRAFT_1328766 [Neocallimastix lanati (nom. inval.)]|nr:hypothetical protein H8356DRAFT_1328766 [Neocallimastix sp. JGI-2020a]